MSTVHDGVVGDPDAALLVDFGAQAAATKATIASPSTGLRIRAPSRNRQKRAKPSTGSAADGPYLRGSHEKRRAANKRPPIPHKATTRTSLHEKSKNGLP